MKPITPAPAADRLRRLLAISFVESFATILVERGVYFYAHHRLGFDDPANLKLALGIGVCYVAGALVSHRLALGLGEKRLLALLLAGHAACHATLFAAHGLPPFIAANLALAALTGAKWPLIESYVGAGRGPAAQAHAVGAFSVAWSLAVPLAVFAVGPLLGGEAGTSAPWRAASLFALAGLLNLVTLAVLVPLEARPAHFADDHPDRLGGEDPPRLRPLLASARWSMLASYTLLFILAPLAPGIFGGLGVPLSRQTALWSLVDATRVVAFVWMQRRPGWHGRAWPLVAAALGLPAGFFLVLFGGHVGVVLLGELVFGLAAGACYYAALYYAMALHNASVDAGGAHESLVGLGFAVGPLAGLAGLALAPRLGGPVAGMLAGVGPVIALGLAAGLGALRRATTGTSLGSSFRDDSRRDTAGP